MRITFLGTGDSGGIPLPGGNCDACERAREVPAFRRGPSSALIEMGDTRILLGAGLPDLAERFPPGSLSAIVLTHFGVDHIQGLFSPAPRRRRAPPRVLPARRGRLCRSLQARAARAVRA